MGETVDWIKGWNDIADAALSAILFYALIVAAVRVLGNRSTAQLNNFDWIINITIGSLAASGILLDSVPALRAVAAIVTLMLLQFALTWLVLRFSWVSRLVKTAPTLLVHKGEYLDIPLRRVRVSREEICGVLRKHGIARVDQANWVILETDGELTVIPRAELDLDQASALEGVEKPARLEP